MLRPLWGPIIALLFSASSVGCHETSALNGGDAVVESSDQGSADVEGTRSGSTSPFEPGPYTPGHTTVTWNDIGRGRELIVEVWYPSLEPASAPESVLGFESDPSARDALRELLDAAPDECPTRVTQGRRDGALVDGLGPLPLLLFSHCLNCGRYSSFSLAERLAGHGFVVVSADHAGRLPFGPNAEGERLSSEQLDVRVQDVLSVLDAALHGGLFDAAPELQALTLDLEKVGVYGHSFGAVTAGKVALADGRIRAVAGLAAPLANPLFPGVEMSDISIPVLQVLAEEDNSILEFGNDFIRQGFEVANPPVWLISLADAGHWSISDVCGLTSAFMAGCGEGIRHSKGNEGDVFTYLSSSEGISIVQRYLTDFMLAHVALDPVAISAQKELPVDTGATVESRLD